MTQSQREKQQQLIDDSELLLDRIESHGFELDRRVCVLRNSGDPVELPLDLEALVRIATFCSTANLQLQRMQDVLTTDQDYAKVNDEGGSEQEPSESEAGAAYLIAQIEMWQNALNSTQKLFNEQIGVNRKQLEVIANLVSILNAGANHGLVSQVQREPNPGIDSHDVGHAAESASSRPEDDSEGGGRTVRITGANAL